MPSALDFLSSDKSFSTTSCIYQHPWALLLPSNRWTRQEKTTLSCGMGQDLLDGEIGFQVPLSREANGLQVPLQRDDMHGNRVKLSH